MFSATESALKVLSRGTPPSLISVDKVASAAARVVTTTEVLISPSIAPAVGQVVAVEVASHYSGQNVLELGNGRLASLKPGDVIIGVLGNRMALRGFVGAVPNHLEAGAPMHILNLGGVIGSLEGAQQGLAAPTEVKYLGTVIEEGRALCLATTARPHASKLSAKLPLIMIAGTCMNAGKTKAAAAIISDLSRQGKRVAAAKLTGVACLRDLHLMADLGAVKTLSFLDFGLPSTVGVNDIAGMVRGVIHGLAEAEPDVAILELGDGILGGYGVEEIFADPQIMASTAALVVCANDFLGAWGAREFLLQQGIHIDCMSGPATDSQAAVSFIEERIGVRAANAVNMPGLLLEIVQEGLNKWQQAQLV